MSHDPVFCAKIASAVGIKVARFYGNGTSAPIDTDDDSASDLERAIESTSKYPRWVPFMPDCDWGDAVEASKLAGLEQVTLDSPAGICDQILCHLGINAEGKCETQS